MSVIQNGQKEADFVSSLPDYAQIFMFLRNFGAILSFPSISLSELENFFLTGHKDEASNVVGIHWKLLTCVARRESRKDWKKMASRFAFRNGLVSTLMSYDELPVETRVELFKLSCEGQFDCNLPFRAELKKLDLPSDKPIGLDRFGRRYWLLKDGQHDVRLYCDNDYDVVPPHTGSWSLQARSIDELDSFITKLDNRRVSNSVTEEEIFSVEKMDIELTKEENDLRMILKPKQFQQIRVSDGCKIRDEEEGERMDVLKSDGGCLKCGVDDDYENMLLCDSCDAECHMYCCYPRLWAVPRGKWACPLCKERALIAELKGVHTQLATERYQFDKATERKQRKVVRLEKTGLLLQNIILSESSTERTRRARKVVNYAELNDVYLPPLGPNDFIASDSISSVTESSIERSVHCVGTRASRRLRDMGRETEQCSVNSQDRRYDMLCKLANTDETVIADPSSPVERALSDSGNSSPQSTGNNDDNKQFSSYSVATIDQSRNTHYASTHPQTEQDRNFLLTPSNSNNIITANKTDSSDVSLASNSTLEDNVPDTI